MIERPFLNRLFSPNILGMACIWLIVLVVFAFPITSALPVLLRVDSTPINIFFKFLYLLLGIFLIIGACFRKESKYISIGGVLILLFWAIYSGRLLYDTLIVGLKFPGMSFFKLYSITFGLVLLSTIAVIFTARYVDTKKAIKYFFYTILLANLSIVFVLYKIYGTLNPITIATRAMFLVELDDGSEISVLNPITLSYFGEILALFSLALLFLKKTKFLRTLFYLFTCAMGIYVLIMGASRGPFLTFVIIAFLLVFINIQFSKKTKTYLLRLSAIFSLFVFTFAYWVVPKLISLNIEFVRRLGALFEDKGDVSIQARDQQWNAAWTQFLENPILGDQFLENYLNYYPHNIYLEALMATGLIGGSIFFAIIGYTLINITLEYFNKDVLIIFSLLLLTALLANFTSGSLFAGSTLWILLAFCFSIKRTNHLAL